MKYFIATNTWENLKEVSQKEWESFMTSISQKGAQEYNLLVEVLSQQPPITIKKAFTGKDDGDGGIFKITCYGEETITRNYKSFHEMEEDVQNFKEAAQSTSVHDDMDRIRKMMGG